MLGCKKIELYKKIKKFLKKVEHIKQNYGKIELTTKLFTKGCC